MKYTPRLVLLLPSATENVCALGLEDALVGITHDCDFPVSVKGKPVLTASRISHATMSSREIDHAANRRIIPAAFESERAEGRVALRDADAKIELVADLQPTRAQIREAGGDRSSVTGGTRVLSDEILVSVTSNPGETFLDRMIALVEGATRQKTPNEIALSILAGILTPTHGELTQAPRRVGWVPQHPAVYSKLSVAQNLRLFARLEKVAEPPPMRGRNRGRLAKAKGVDRRRTRLHPQRARAGQKRVRRRLGGRGRWRFPVVDADHQHREAEDVGEEDELLPLLVGDVPGAGEEVDPTPPFLLSQLHLLHEGMQMTKKMLRDPAKAHRACALNALEDRLGQVLVSQAARRRRGHVGL